MLELRCSHNYDFLGIVGKKTGLQDMNGDNLYVGDIVCKDNDKFKGKDFVITYLPQIIILIKNVGGI